MIGLGVRPERTAWRDLALSERHRKWGWDCPMIDLDFVCLEYDEGRAEILVEYKHRDAQPVSVNHASYRALRDLGDRAKVPVFTVRYVPDFSVWRVTPLNDLAEYWVPDTALMGEEEYVSLLYRVRGRTMPDGLLKRVDREA